MTSHESKTRCFAMDGKAFESIRVTSPELFQKVKVDLLFLLIFIKIDTSVAIGKAGVAVIEAAEIFRILAF